MKRGRPEPIAPRFHWRTLLTSFVIGLLLLAWLTPEPQSQDLLLATHAELIEQILSSPPTEQRLATVQLLSRGTSSIPQIVQKLDDAASDQIPRLLAILDDSLVSSDLQMVMAAESALEQLKKHPSGEVVEATMAVLEANSVSRHARAIGALQDLGAEFRRSRSRVQASGMLDFEFAVLDERWTGGDPGLQHFLRLEKAMTVHIDETAKISQEAIANLQQRYEDEGHGRSRVRTHKSGCLGLIPQRLRRGLEVAVVIRNSPAERAGVSVGDVIVAYNSQVLTEFKELSLETSNSQPGTIVQLTVEREGRQIGFDIPLGTDFGTGHCRCIDLATSAKKIPQNAPLSPIPDVLPPSPAVNQETAQLTAEPKHEPEQGDPATQRFEAVPEISSTDRADQPVLQADEPVDADAVVRRAQPELETVTEEH